MLGSSTIVSLTLLLSSISCALPHTDVLSQGNDSANGPRDFHETANLTGNLELVSDKPEEIAVLKKMPTGMEGLEALAADLPHYESLTVIGDSYSSGDGAFGSSTDEDCKRNKGSHGSRLNSILKPTSFAYLACSGASALNVLKNQVESQSFGTPDLVTMTAGGNNDDIFVKLLLACILLKSKEECDNALKVGEATLLKLPATLTPLYEAIMNKTGDDGAPPQVLHLGYVKIWARDTSRSECPKDGTDVSWASNGFGGHRDKINDLISRFNKVTKAEAEENGVIFVGVDPYFEGHRLCDGQDASWLQHGHFGNNLTSEENGVLCHPTFDGHSAYINATLHALKGQQLVDGEFVHL
ncbi:Endoribonuclease [Venturia inaequalis]|nr:Endoribonuclease [Venturia inaequalis]